MADAKDQDQSMEEILQSIKRIIAEEGDPAPPAASGEDVLELTDMLSDDGSVSQAATDGGNVPTMSIEEIMAAPLSTGAPEPVAPPPVAAAPAPAPVAKPAPAAAGEEGLVSDRTRHAASTALHALKQPPAAAPAFAASASPVFRSGITVEDLVIEALKPMLREWLDANLTGLVQQLVEKEIRRISQ